MHAIHADTHRALLAAVAALVLALAFAALPSTLGELSPSDGAPAATSASATAAPALPATWATDPLASPLERLRQP